jgi:hypothetical protein
MAARNPEMTQKNDARARALNQFFASDRRDEQAKAEVAKQRAAADANTARLRALRLAKEEADRLAKIEFDAANPPRARKTKTAKPA